MPTSPKSDAAGNGRAHENQDWARNHRAAKRFRCNDSHMRCIQETDNNNSTSKCATENTQAKPEPEAFRAGTPATVDSSDKYR
jgi:hypothetical protein